MQTDHILCPTDFSAPADQALDYAALGAQRSGATLHLIHVVEPSPAAVGFTPEITQQVVHMAQAEEQMARKELEERAQKLEEQGVTVATDTCSGNAADAIVRYADDHDVDLIVTATNGTTGWRRWVFGSVAEVVVRKSPCPVLVVPAPDDGDADAAS